MYTEDDLKKMRVTGKDGLRELVVREKIFTGISSLKKKEIVDRIIDSKWWSRNCVDETDAPKKLTKKQQKDKLKAELQEIDSRLEKAVIEPLVIEPVVTDPVVTDPVVTDPVVTEEPLAPTEEPLAPTPHNSPRNADQLRDVLGSMFRDDFIDTLLERLHKK